MSDDDGSAGDEAGGTPQAKKVQLRISDALNNVITIIAQSVNTTDDGGVLAGIDLKGINYDSNGGVIIERLLLAPVALKWSPSGKQLWRAGRPEAKLHWMPHAKKGSRRPADPRHTALDDCDPNLVHDAGAAPRGNRGATAAANAARPKPTRNTIELIEAVRADAVQRGSGWGHTPRAISAVCLCEQVP
jgi:hypothetical protein